MADNVPAPAESNSKKPWLSKTLIFNAVMALAALEPHVADWAKNHVETVMMFLGAVNMLLRFLSKDKISLQD